MEGCYDPNDGIHTTTIRQAVDNGALAAFAVLVACSGGESESPSTQTVAVSPSIEQEVGATIATGEPDGAVAPVAGAFRFQLPSASDDTVSLESYVGDKNVVLVFYRAFW